VTVTMGGEGEPEEDGLRPISGDVWQPQSETVSFNGRDADFVASTA